MSLDFLKNLTEKKTTKGKRGLRRGLHSRLDLTSGIVDGQPPKRRGPKPDAKPALTRRQELNRQAQRYGRVRETVHSGSSIVGRTANGKNCTSRHWKRKSCA